MKLLFYLVFIFYFIELNAQTDKNIIIRSNLGYNFNHKDNVDAGTNGNQSFIGGINYGELNIGISAGKKFSPNFYYGVGILYNHSKEETNPNVKFPDLNGSGFVSLSSYINTITKTSSISPLIFVQYYKNIYEKLCISIDLYSKYSFISNLEESSFYFPDNQNMQYIKSGNVSKSEYDQQFLAVGICPSLRFNIYKNLGIELTFGKVEYSHKINDSRYGSIVNKTKELEVGFKPENWMIGFYFSL